MKFLHSGVSIVNIPVFRYLLVLCLSVSILGCDAIRQLSQPKSETVLASYFQAVKEGRTADAYAFLSAEDKSVQPVESFLGDGDNKSEAFVALLRSSMEYKVLSVTENGDKATASVEMTQPDISVLMKEMMGAAFAAAFSAKKDHDTGAILEKQIADKYAKGNLPTVKKTEVMNLVREDDGWKVYLGLLEKKQKKEREEQINALLKEASSLKTNEKLVDSLAKYDAVLTIDNNNKDALEARHEVSRLLDEAKTKNEYIQNIELYDVKSRYYETYLDGRKPGVEFKLKNKGDRSLDRVQVTVYFKDPSGAVIAEEDYTPVLVTEYSFGSNKPLKPNYIWQMESGKFYKAESVPTEWKEGAVSAKITRIEFSKN